MSAKIHRPHRSYDGWASRMLDLGLTEATTNAVIHGSDREAAETAIEELDTYLGLAEEDDIDRER